MQIIINTKRKFSLWALFSADLDIPEMPVTMEALAQEIQKTLEFELDVDHYKSVKVYYPEGGPMRLSWRPVNCEKCEEAEAYSCGWCPDHTWSVDEGNGDQARAAAIKHGVPQWLVDAIDKINDGNLHIG